MQIEQKLLIENKQTADETHSILLSLSAYALLSLKEQNNTNVVSAFNVFPSFHISYVHHQQTIIELIETEWDMREKEWNELSAIGHIEPILLTHRSMVFIALCSNRKTSAEFGDDAIDVHCCHCENLMLPLSTELFLRWDGLNVQCDEMTFYYMH